MHTAKLRTVGGSTMVAIPPAIRETLKLASKSEVSIAVEGDRLVITPKIKLKPRLSYDERMAMCDPTAPISPEEQEWIDAPRMGREVI